MISSLHIENIAVVKSLDIDLSDNFTVLTGETGAGKSIIVDSISLILGAPFKADLLRTGETNCSVNAIFCDISKDNLRLLEEMGIVPDDEGSIFVQRDFNIDGKAKNKINGKTVSVGILRSAMGLLCNIHGQHDNQKLLDSKNHILLLDAWVGFDDLLSRYKTEYDMVKEIEEQIADTEMDAAEKERNIEMLKFQIEDIYSVKLKEGDEEALEQRLELLKNQEIIQKNTSIIYRALFRNEKGASASSLIDMASKSINSLEDVWDDGEEIKEKLISIKSELEDIAETAYSLGEYSSNDPEKEMDEIQSKLNKISKLKRKYGSDISEILAYGEDAKKRLEKLESSDLSVKELTHNLKIHKDKARELALELHEKRAENAIDLEKQICEQLNFLDMKSAVFKVKMDFADENINPRGFDKVEFLLSANKGEEPKPLSDIASGGELARIMLGIKSIFADKEGTETIVYDEIDTGISGKTSQKLGLVLKNCAKSTQIFCVTHSAQIAAAAEHHLLVSKQTVNDRTVTGVTELSGDDRIHEIARIMGGNNITKELLESARNLILETK